MKPVSMMVPSPGPDSGDLESVFVGVAPALWRAITAYLGGRADLAEDVVLEAFTRALAQPKIRNPVGWLYKTAFRLAAAEVTRGRRFTQADLDLPIEHAPELQDLFASLIQLPPRQRAAIVLHYHLGFPVKEIARILGISVPTVKVHLHRGRNRLRDIYREGSTDE